MSQAQCVLFTWTPYKLWKEHDNKGSWFGGFEWTSCKGTEFTVDLYLRILGFELTFVI